MKFKCEADGLNLSFFFPEGNLRGSPGKKGRKNGAMTLDEREADHAKYCTGEEDGVVCPSLMLCRHYAYENNYDGVWGGTSSAQRTQIRIGKRKFDEV